MTDKDWIIFKRTIGYEWDYLSRKFQLRQKVFGLISLLCIVITGLGDTQSFFTGENSPIPETLQFLKQPNISLFLSITILLLGYLITVSSENKQNQKDTHDVLDIVKEYVIPGLNNELEDFLKDIHQQFTLNGNIRLSLWIPVRKSVFRWNLQMVCKTKNIPDRELKASFRLDEGVIGYSYLKNRTIFLMEYLDVSNVEQLTQLTQSYVDLQGDNKILINSNIKGVVAVGSFVKSSVVGLLAIDTDNSDDSAIMKNDGLHSLALDWIIQYTSSIGLLWRMNNNI